MEGEKLENAQKKLTRALTRMEETLEPLLTVPLDQHLQGMSSLDKAQLSCLAAFSLESLIFVYLKTQGMDPKKHHIHDEIKRLREYRQKIKEATAGVKPSQPAMRLDKGAAGRFVKHALAGNQDQTEEGQLSPLGKRKLDDLAEDFLAKVAAEASYTSGREFTLESGTSTPLSAEDTAEIDDGSTNNSVDSLETADGNDLNNNQPDASAGQRKRPKVQKEQQRKKKTKAVKAISDGNSTHKPSGNGKKRNRTKSGGSSSSA
ncbi:hypothetical protein HDU85_002217 [Gaertneriomyces sp. JEL0708]|nr:hypothetical protein HDU85_002217 [Gaertneriomyces sp. JEL0708]